MEKSPASFAAPVSHGLEGALEEIKVFFQDFANKVQRGRLANILWNGEEPIKETKICDLLVGHFKEKIEKAGGVLISQGQVGIGRYDFSIIFESVKVLVEIKKDSFDAEKAMSQLSTYMRGENTQCGVILVMDFYGKWSSESAQMKLKKLQKKILDQSDLRIPIGIANCESPKDASKSTMSSGRDDINFRWLLCALSSKSQES